MSAAAMQTWGEVRIAGGRAVPPAAMDEREARVPDVARWWAQEGVEGIHVTDVDGALESGRNWTHLEAVARLGLPLRFGGGIRHMTEVQQLLDLGVHQVVVGTQGIDHPEWLRELITIFPRRVVAGIDVRSGDVLVDGRRRVAPGRPDDRGAAVAGTALAGILYAALDGESAGMPDPATIRALHEVAPVTVAGHGGADEVRSWEDAGATGVLYDGDGDPGAWRDL